MAFCTHCGNRISDLAVACPKCGTETPVALSVASAPVLERTFTNAPMLRPLGIGEIIDAAIKIYRSNAGALLKAVALVVVPVQIVSALIQASAIPDPAAPLQQTPLEPGTVPTPGFDTSSLWTFIAAALVGAGLNWLAAQLATAASLRAVSEAYLGERADWRQSLEFAFRRLGPLVWLSVISAVGVGIGYVFCFIPGIWLSVAWSVAVPVLLIENIRGTKALGRSFDLVKGRWWPVAGATVLGQIIAAVLSFVFGLASGALSFVEDSALITFISNGITTAISQTLVTPFLAAMIAIIYYDLRVRKEGFDLELLTQQVGGFPPAPGSGGPAPAPGWIPPSPGAPGAPAARAPSVEPTEPARPRPRARPTRAGGIGEPQPPGMASGGVEEADPSPAPAPQQSFARPPPRKRPVRPGFEPEPAPDEEDEPSDPDR